MKGRARAAEALHLHLQDERSGSASGPVDELYAIVAGAMVGSTMSRRSRNARSTALNQPDLFSLFGNKAIEASAVEIIEMSKSNVAELAPRLRPEPKAHDRSATPVVASQRLPWRSAEPTPVHLLDVRAAAAWLGLSKSTLDKMRCYGVGPRFIRATGRAVRYDPADLAAFADGRRQSRTTDEAPV